MANNTADATRPKRSTTMNVDYNLKKRRVIPNEDVESRSGSSSSVSSNLEGLGLENGRQNGNNGISGEGTEEFSGPVIVTDSEGKVLFNEPPTEDPKNGMTGIPLSQRPKSSVPAASTLESTYKEKLQTEKSTEITKGSDIRTKLKVRMAKREDSELENQDLNAHAAKVSKKLKLIKDNRDHKLFGQNDKVSHLHIPEIDPSNNTENDDFCSTCHASGIFLCCDTCPKSFHFACCNPPLDANHLPEGDWSCDECRFKQLVKNNELNLSEKKLRAKFISDNSTTAGYQLFGSMLFQLQKINPSQFQLPAKLKSTFDSVYSGLQGEYKDERFKDPLNDKLLYNAPYGQSITKLDSYQPDHHFKQNTGELLLCYGCGKSKVGTWDQPDSQRLIMTCDYCSTPWHLDCLPMPRASMKNLGTKWKCPLHAPLPKNHKRRLAQGKQEYIVLPVGSKNNGDADIILQKDCWKIPRITEQNVALQFLDKVYQAKKVQERQKLLQDSQLLEKIVDTTSRSDLKNLLYFQASADLKKLWDFKELCELSQNLLTNKGAENKEEQSEMHLLKKLRQILESKPKEDVIKFFSDQ